ncbi:MAG: hypothetical protein QXI72_05740 [Candidatus Nezhaarchaeales archaeon]
MVRMSMSLAGASSPSYNVVEAYNSMKRGILYIIIGWLLIGVGLMTLLGIFAITPIGVRSFGLVMAITVIALIVIGAIIGLVGLYAHFIPGTTKLASIDPRYSTAATLTKIGYVWGLVLLIIGVPLIFAFFIGLPVMIVGYILLILGYVGVIILCFKLNEVEQNTLYLVAGIMFIIAIFISVVGFVAWILLYVALGDSIRKHA